MQLSPLARLKAFFGVTGVHEDEAPLVKRLDEAFYWMMLLIVFWLPFESYFELHGGSFPKIFEVAGWIIWITFVIKTFTLTILVKRKLHYLLTNWNCLFIVLVGCPLIWDLYPQLGQIKILRLLLPISVIVPWIPVGCKFLMHNRFSSTLLMAIICSGLSGALISTVDPGIKSPWMGVWWAWETFTTVGYGDVVPVTFVGRAVAVVIMILGACLYSLLTANFSAFLIKTSKANKEGHLSEEKNIIQILKGLEEKVEKLEKQLSEKNSIRPTS